MVTRRGCACKLTHTHDIMYIYVHYNIIYIYTHTCVSLRVAAAFRQDTIEAGCPDRRPSITAVVRERLLLRAQMYIYIRVYAALLLRAVCIYIGWHYNIHTHTHAGK